VEAMTSGSEDPLQPLPSGSPPDPRGFASRWRLGKLVGPGASGGYHTFVGASAPFDHPHGVWMCDGVGRDSRADRSGAIEARLRLHHLCEVTRMPWWRGLGCHVAVMEENDMRSGPSTGPEVVRVGE
jgi:hypothetical protein